MSQMRVTKQHNYIIYVNNTYAKNILFFFVRTLMGHECVELRNTAAAVQCYRKYVRCAYGIY